MKKIIKAYNCFEEVFLVALIAAMTIIIFMQVVMRYCFNESLSWSEELARIMFIWASWIGISLGEKKSEHIKITMVTDRLKGKAQKFTLIAADICTLIILGILCVEGVGVVEHIFVLKNMTPAVGFPKWLVYGAVPLSCALMGARVCKSLIYRIANKLPEEVK